MLFQRWPRPGVRDHEKRAFVRAAIRCMNSSIAAFVHPERMALVEAPVAKQVPAVISAHGDERPDPYGWLRDDGRTRKDVLEHLEAENEYCRIALADTEALQQDLVKEMRGRIQEADQSVAVRRRGHYYYTRTREGEQYRVHCRRPVPEHSGPEMETSKMDESLPEEVLLDEDEEAKAHDFYDVAGLAVSDDGKRLAYALDTVGAEKYEIHVIDLGSDGGERRNALHGRVTGTSGQVMWAADCATFFYVLLDKILRPYKVMRLNVADDAAEAECVFEERDEQYFVSISRSSDLSMLLISSSATMQNEELYLPSDHPGGAFQVLAPRQPNVEYSTERWHESWIFTQRTESTPNSELYTAPLSDFSAKRLLLPHSDAAKVEDILVTEEHLTLVLRQGGLQQVLVHQLPKSKAGTEISLANGKAVDFEDEVYEVGLASQGDFTTRVLHLAYSSLARPETWLACNMDTMKTVQEKVAPVLGGFDQTNYVSKRLWTQSHDGVKVPISLVYNKKTFQPQSGGPLHLYVYGAYEVCNDPAFSRNRLSLLDRGAAFAIAHCRGGGEMGRLWYEHGKFLYKRNTFLDVIAVAEHLVAEQWTKPERMTLEGRSAGGMTAATVTNMRPDLFSGVVMGVPFVDCLTTMLDESIPLTTMEFEEWGNPKDMEYYNYMKTYSPLDNIVDQDYPAILVTAGLHDPRVAYWEPAKYVATLRSKTAGHKDRKLLLLKTELGAGHFSATGRFDILKERALDLAFTLKQLGLAHA